MYETGCSENYCHIVVVCSATQPKKKSVCICKINFANELSLPKWSRKSYICAFGGTLMRKSHFFTAGPTISRRKKNNFDSRRTPMLNMTFGLLVNMTVFWCHCLQSLQSKNTEIDISGNELRKQTKQIEMVENDCRLCFEKKSTLIAIFTSNGIELEIAEIIRKHLPDEVSLSRRLHNYWNFISAGISF